MDFEKECREKNWKCESLVNALLKSTDHMPAVIVEHDGDLGIAFLPTGNFAAGLKCGSITVVWQDGDVTAGDFIENIVGDAWQLIRAGMSTLPAGQNPAQ